jgi:tRNA-Thr(GGU) m(6)t(6)A37 methyltransferase TsaA
MARPPGRRLETHYEAARTFVAEDLKRSAANAASPYSRVAMDERTYAVRPIGWVESPLTSRADAPKQGDEGAPDAWIVIEAAYAEGLRGLQVGDRIVVLTWLDRAQRDVLTTRPRDDPQRDPVGVFATRAPDRPNPIGLHQVDILAIDGVRMLVGRLEALDGTPVVDVKPVLGGVDDR